MDETSLLVSPSFGVRWLNFRLTQFSWANKIPLKNGRCKKIRKLRRKKQPEPERPPSRKKPSITDIEATEEEKKKIAKGTTFDLEKELGVTAKEAKEALEQEGELKSEKETSVDLDQLDKQLDQIISDLE